MFILVNKHGHALTGRTGQPYLYSSLQMATIAAKILGKRDQCYYRVDDA